MTNKTNIAEIYGPTVDKKTRPIEAVITTLNT